MLFGGRLRWLLAAWETRRITPIICRQTVIELIRVLDKPKFGLDTLKREQSLARYILYSDEHVLNEPRLILPVACRDVDDVVFLELALAANADCLVTGDEDLLALRGALPLRIFTPIELQAAHN